MALTDTFIRALKSVEKTNRYSDSAGLYLQVTPKGSRLWRMAFRFNGKQKTLAFGKYPEITLSDARRKHDDAKLCVII